MNPRIEKLLAMHRNEPADTFVLFALAKEYQQMGDFEKANNYFQLLKTTDPDYVGLYFHLAKNYEAINELEDAINTYKQGILIAKKLKDLHAESELKNELINLELEL